MEASSSQPSQPCLSEKLRQKMNAQRMKRSGTSQKKAFLEKNKIPPEMMDQYVKALNHQNAPNLMAMMNQMSTPGGMQSALQQAMAAIQPRMAPPTGVADLVKEQVDLSDEVVPEAVPIDPIAHLRPSVSE